MKFTPFRTTLIYFVFAVIWITTTDQILEWMAGDLAHLSQMQTAKGLFYISLTAAGLYLMMRSYEKNLSKSRGKISSQDKRLRIALDSAKMAVWEYDVVKNDYMIFESQYEMFGLEGNDNFQIEDFYKRIHPDDYDNFKKKEYDTLYNGSNLDVQYRVVLPQGVKWLWTRAEPTIKDGKVVSLSGITADIDEDKRLQLQLEREQELQNKIIGAIPVMITVYRPDISEFRVNEEFERITGWDNESIKDVDLMLEVYPDPNYRLEVAEFMMKPGTGWKDFKMRIRNGSVIETSWTNVRLSDDTQIGIGIDITERKRLEEDLEIEKERLEKLFDRIPVLIVLFDKNQNMISMNQHVYEVLGWTKEDLEHHSILELCYPDPEYREKVMQEIYDLKEEWKEFDVLSKSGEIRKQLWTNLSLSDETNVAIGYDITERKLLEDKIAAEREELQKIIDSMPVMINMHEQDPSKVNMNKYFESVIGYKNEEITQEEFVDLIIEEKDRDLVRKVISESDGKWYDFDLLSKEGKILKTIWTNIQISESRSLGIGVDITERKEMEEKLRESEEWLSLTTGSASIGKWEWNPQTGEIIIDQVWAGLIGYTVDELEPVNIDTWNELVHPDDYERFEKAYGEYAAGKKEMYECEVRMKHKDGEWIWILDRGRAIERDDEGRLLRLVGTHIDISDKKKYEESLAYQASLLSNVSDAVISTNPEFIILTWNKAAENVYGWKSEEVVGKNLGSLLRTEFEPGEDKQSAENKLLESGSWHGEIVHVTKSGKRKNILSSVTRIKDAKGDFSGVVAVNRDITERKSFEKEVSLLANVFLESNTALAVTSHHTNKLERVNRAYAKLFGYDEEEMVGMDIHDLYPSDARQRTINTVDELEKKGQVTFEAVLKRKDDSVFESIVNLSLVAESDSQASYRISTVQDISELKKTQKQLVYERQRFELASGSVSDVVWEWNPESRKLWWGEGLETLLGYRKEDYEGDLDFWKNHIHEDDRERVVSSMTHAETSDAREWEAEYRFFAADGSIRTVKDSAVLIRDENNELLRVIGAMVDVTQLLEYQEALQLERNRFELIAKSSNDVLYDFDIETMTVWWSEGWQTRFGYADDGVEDSLVWWSDNIHPEDRERVNESVFAAIDDGSSFWVGRYRFKNGEGEYRYVIDKGYFIKNQDGKSVNLVGTISDITADIEARENLKASEEQYRLLFELSPLPMFIYDPETLHFISANNSAVEKYLYTEEELKKMKIFQLHPQSDHKEIMSEITSNLKQKRTGFDVWPQVKKPGEKILAEISGSEIHYEGKVRRLVVINDITEQKKAEELAISAIVEGEERERQRVAKELHDGLGQYLSAANMNLETVYEDAKDIHEPYRSVFRNGLKLLNHAISETRSISQNLLPKAIQDYGLELGIESLINQLRGTNNVKFYLYQNLDNVDIPDNIQINVYRIAQEAINNALRHGEPKTVNVQLIFSKGEILLTVEDDGKGFDPDNVQKGIGLQSMKTRTGAMSGSIEIISNKRKGTIVSVAVPT